VPPLNIAHHCAERCKRQKKRNLHRKVVKSVEVKLEAYRERYFCHTPSSEPNLWRRYLVSKMIRFLKSGDTSVSVCHILESLSKVLHYARCGVVAIVSARIQCGGYK
jgi:hypothetical protein